MEAHGHVPSVPSPEAGNAYSVVLAGLHKVVAYTHVVHV